MNDKRVLDFLIIGAQKAGTTSLFKYLQAHPQLYLLPEKEASFFCHDERFSRGWDWYLREFLSDAPAGRLWGKASPDYMADPRVPQRMCDLLPGVKLITLLRDPIERAYSQYLMSFRRGLDQRTFEQAVRDLLAQDALAEARGRPTPINSYIVRGEYARILAGFYEHFASSQVAVFFTDELACDPGAVFRQICEFLSIDSDFVPPDLGVRYHKGGAKRRWPWMDRMKQGSEVRALWRLLPARRRRVVSYWFHQWRSIPDDDDAPVSVTEATRDLLVQHYAHEMRHLPALIGREIPWATWK